ncbi:phorbol-12-myristate-13-acetate-induced protein 1 [Puntigrus tetrazona]|nr:phorbol-12-myristate-13-acetate-induced protein 1 [Puntigrus tetrazona]
MAKKERAAAAECAHELRGLGDLLDRKHRLLKIIIIIIITLQKQHADGNR